VHAVAGVLRTVRGQILVDGADLTRVAAHQVCARGVAIVPEGRRVFANLTVRDNLLLGAHRRGARAGHRTAFARVCALFPRLLERVDQAAGTLSGGEQQMLAIGRALMSKPRLLLIDEASLGLSPALAKTVFKVVKRINDDGVTVIIVEQNVGVLPYADRALIMEKGTLIFSGVGAEIRNANLRETYLGGDAE
jgi:branched-chain amino acid transport system ATP-binding protein